MQELKPPMPGTQQHVADSGQISSSIIDRFSLIEGGLIYRFQCWLKLAMPDSRKVVRRPLLSMVVTWVPLLILSLSQSRAAGGVQIPFLRDFAVNVQFLISLPLLIAAETVIDPKLRHAVRHFVHSGLVGPRQLPAFEAAILKTMQLRDAILPGIVLILLAFAQSFWAKTGEFLASGSSNWHTLGSTASGSLSLAGWWFAWVSGPLYRLCLYRWVWIIFVWATFLVRVTRLDLGWIPTHPDRAGGLGFLANTQLSFGLVGFATTALVSGKFANMIAFDGKTLSDLKALMIASAVLAIIVLAAPMLVFSRRLHKIKEKGMFDYGTLAVRYVQDFDGKWNRRQLPDQQSLLGTPDLQSLADLSNSYSVVERMRMVLLDKQILVKLAIQTTLPMLLLVAVETPAQELIQTVLKLMA